MDAATGRVAVTPESGEIGAPTIEALRQQANKLGIGLGRQR